MCKQVHELAVYGSFVCGCSGAFSVLDAITYAFAYEVDCTSQVGIIPRYTFPGDSDGNLAKARTLFISSTCYSYSLPKRLGCQPGLF